MAATSVLKLKVDDKEYNASLKQAQQGMLTLERALQDAGKSFTQVDKSVLNYVRGIGQMEAQAKTTRGKIGEMSNAFVELSSQYNRMSEEVKRSDFGKALSASLEQLKQRTQEAKLELQDLNKQLDGKTETGTGQLGNVIDTLGSKLGISGNLTEMLTSKTALMTAGIGASVAIIGKATDAWVSYNSELAKQDQITTVTTGLKGLGSDRMTDSARAMVDTYDVDFRSVINAANTLMTQFGETGEQATQIIREGLQGMIQGDGPKLLSMIQQYAPAFRDAGVSASQLVAVIQNSEGGIFTDQNMNAIVMGIKNIRLMTNATSEALGKLGIDGEKMSKQLSDGTLTIFDALKQVATAIQGVDSNSKAAGEVMQTVFGRQGAMAGTKLGEAIATLNTNLEETKRQTGELGDAYDDLFKANEKLNKAIRDCFEYDGWDQMATAIKSNLITALASVVDWLGKIKNGFTEAGRARNAYESMGGDSQVDKMIKNLGNGLGQTALNTYNRQLDNFDKRINELSLRVASYGSKSDSTTDAERNRANAQLAAIKKEREEYVRRAQELHNNATRPTTTRTPTPTNTPTPRTTPSRGGGGGSHVETPQEQAAKKVNAALASYAATIEKADLRMEAGLDTEADHQKKQLAAKERLYEAYTDAYTIYKDPSYKEASLAAAKEIERLTGEVKATTEAQDAAKKAARELESAQKKLADAQRELATAQESNDLKGVLAAEKKINAAQADIDRLKPAEVPVMPKWVQAAWDSIPAETKKALSKVGEQEVPVMPKWVQAAWDSIPADTKKALAKVGEQEVHVMPKWVQAAWDSIPAETKKALAKVGEQEVHVAASYTTGNLEAFIDSLKGKIAQSEVGSELYNNLTSQLADATALGNLIQTAVKNGVDIAKFDPQLLWKKIFGETPGDYIDDATWQGHMNTLNQSISDAGGDNRYAIDTNTGAISEDKDDRNTLADSQKLVSGLSSVSSGLQQMGVELPKEVNDTLSVLQGIITVVQGIQTVISVFSTTTAAAQIASQTANTTALVANTVALGALASAISFNAATNFIPFFSQGGLIGRAAGGMLIPGNSLSGDRLRMPVDTGGYVGVNSGELILNKAQSNVIASALDNQGQQTGGLQPYVDGEKIFLGMNNTSKRMGRGEIVTTGMLRKMGLM